MINVFGLNGFGWKWIGFILIIAGLLGGYIAYLYEMTKIYYIISLILLILGFLLGWGIHSLVRKLRR